MKGLRRDDGRGEPRCWMAGAAVCLGALLHIVVHSASLLIIDNEPTAVQGRQAGSAPQCL